MSDHNFPTPDFIALGKEIKKGIFIIAEREFLPMPLSKNGKIVNSLIIAQEELYSMPQAS